MRIRQVFCNSNDIQVSSLWFRISEVSILYLDTSKFIKASFIIDDPSQIFVNNCLFSTNNEYEYASNFAVFEFNSFAKACVKNCIFTQIKKLKIGSCFYLSDSNTLMIFDSFFDQIENSEGGNIIYSYSDNLIKLRNITISNILSYDKGTGILLLQQNYFIIEVSTIIDFFTTNTGGFLHAFQSKNYIRVQNVVSLNGTSSEGAFGYLNFENFLYIENSKMIGNNVRFSGGFLFFNNDNIALLNNVSVQNSYSKEISGILTSFERNSIKIINTEFKNSSSIMAGGMYFRLSNKIVILNCSFEISRAIDSGGLFKLLSENRIKISFCKINNTKTDGKGSSFYLDNNNHLIINSCLFTDSHSSYDFLFAVNLNYIIVSFNIIEYTNSNFECFGDFQIVQKDNFLKIFKNEIIRTKLNYFIYSQDLSQFLISNIRISNMTFRKNFIYCYSGCGIIISALSYIDLNMTGISLFFNLRNSSIYLINCTLKATELVLGSIIFSKMLITNVKICQLLINNKQIFLNTYLSLLIMRNNFFISTRFLFNISKILIYKSSFQHSDYSLFEIQKNTEKFFEFASVRIKCSIFLKNKGSLLSFSSNSFDYRDFLVKRSIFILNFDQRGFIYINSLKKMLIVQSKFLYNYSQRKQEQLAKGGVFYFESKMIPNVSFLNNTFISNKADIGGILYLQAGFPFLNFENFLDKNLAINNSAKLYGNNLATKIYQISFGNYEYDVFGNNVINELVSGKSYENCLAILFFLDYYCQITWSNDEDKNKFIRLSDKSLLSNIRYDQGQLCFTGYFKMNSVYNINRLIPLIIMFDYTEQEQTLFNSSITLSYSFRSCIKGEKLSDDYRCLECPRNFYSFSKSLNESSNCQICSRDKGFLCYGGQNITIIQSFWRKNRESSRILKCPNPDSCLGDQRILDKIHFPSI